MSTIHDNAKVHKVGHKTEIAQILYLTLISNVEKMLLTRFESNWSSNEDLNF